MGERQQVLGEGRDLAELRQRFLAQARESLRDFAPKSGLERSGITSWDFDELPRQVMRRAHGHDVPCFPALVDRGNQAAIELFETEELAERAHLGGVRRLLQFASKAELAGFEKRMPAPLLRRAGLPPSKAEQEAFSESIRTRVVSEAFSLSGAATLPRSRSELERLLSSGAPRLAAAFETTLKLVSEIRAELDNTLRALDAAKSQPSAQLASADIRQQLELLLPPDLLAQVELARVVHVPRYLSAMRARLVRAIHDPRKDASKAEPITPVLRTFATKYPTLADRSAARHVLFWLEELRVAAFAPELRPLRPPTVAEATRAVAELR
jgi:ATP-dependent helicase HrpA